MPIARHTSLGRRLPACTTTAVGREATADGSVIVSHSDDDVADERVIFVPARDHPRGARRNVYYDDASLGHEGFEEYNATELRRYIGKDRGPGYDTDDFRPSVPLGSIEQVEHTYAYFDGNYGIMNEHQLMIGECTCGAKVHPLPEKDRRIFYASELSRVALERCSKAADAVRVMGGLIADHGLFGTGETLIVGDPEEAWVMEMCAYDRNEPDGIWVARRVPDNALFVAANQFRIREVVRDADDMMYSENLFDVCKAKGWWDESVDGPLDWAQAVSYGEYGHPYYSLRRVWGVLRRVAPARNFPAWVEGGYTKAYPFAVEPEAEAGLTVLDVASLHRNHYEGTEFDLTQGLAAGPYGDPSRYEGNADRGSGHTKDDPSDTKHTSFNLDWYHTRGAWERALSIFRCGTFWVNQGRSHLPDPVGGVSWIGLDRPATTCLLPFFVGIESMPKSVETMLLTDFSFDSAWWAFNFVANYATLRYGFMIHDIRKEQSHLERKATKEVGLFDRDSTQTELTEFCHRWTGEAVDAWWELAKRLIVKYNDGCITDENGIMQHVGYPNRKWLKTVGFYDGPTEY
jgi:dipeptidase